MSFDWPPSNRKDNAKRNWGRVLDQWYLINRKELINHCLKFREGVECCFDNDFAVDFDHLDFSNKIPPTMTVTCHHCKQKRSNQNTVIVTPGKDRLFRLDEVKKHYFSDEHQRCKYANPKQNIKLWFNYK